MPMKVHRSQVVIPPPLGPVNDAVCASPDMSGMEGQRHAAQRAFDHRIGVPLDDRWGTRHFCGGLVRCSILAAGPQGTLINALIVRGDSRGQGYARATLEALCALADEVRIPLLIHTMPMEAEVEPLRLARFYSSLGFIALRDGTTMQRKPGAASEGTPA